MVLYSCWPHYHDMEVTYTHSTVPVCNLICLLGVYNTLHSSLYTIGPMQPKPLYDLIMVACKSWSIHNCAIVQFTATGNGLLYSF